MTIGQIRHLLPLSYTIAEVITTKTHNTKVVETYAESNVTTYDDIEVECIRADDNDIVVHIK